MANWFIAAFPSYAARLPLVTLLNGTELRNFFEAPSNTANMSECILLMGIEPTTWNKLLRVKWSHLWFLVSWSAMHH